VLLWLDQDLLIYSPAAYGIAKAGASGKLFVSDISIWELGVALYKKSLERRPNLRGLSIEEWFAQTTKRLDARIIRISQAIAIEAANVPGVYGSGDPGDCFLIATARMRRLSLVTRDSKMIALAKRDQGYLDVTVC
jgi:PIN domain nuclease of toxin-antitoxin system